jgi:hypothetical protein
VKRIIGPALILIISSMQVFSAYGWSNGGYSDDPSNPKYGTHDWIAQHALDWLQPQEKQFILDHLAAYEYGTELPDNKSAPWGIGDTGKHHVYYFDNATLQDSSSGERAQEEYTLALNYAKYGDWANASMALGAMTHYIADVAVFGHVMGSGTDWGSEVHHDDYENYVEGRTSSYSDEFSSYLVFDGVLETVNPYDAALELAFNTTFGDNGNFNCTWMDQNYDWTNAAFKNRCVESLNLAVNVIADVLHTFSNEAAIPEFPHLAILPVLAVLALFATAYASMKRELLRL